jgi:hypothetical protein
MLRSPKAKPVSRSGLPTWRRDRAIYWNIPGRAAGKPRVCSGRRRSPWLQRNGSLPDGYNFKSDTLLAPKETGNFRDDVLKNWDWLGNEAFPPGLPTSYTLDKIAELTERPDICSTNGWISHGSG